MRLIAHPAHRRREAGIALIVVFILFLVLYLVVFQLEYSTKMEEELSEVRATESQGAFAIVSTAAYVLSLLAEDYEKDMSESSALGTETAGAGEAGAPGAGEAGAPAAGGGGPGDSPETRVAGSRSGSGDPATGEARRPEAGAPPAGPKALDYILESIFNPVTQDVNGVQAKIRMVDNERQIDLNQPWVYVRERIESLSDEAREEMSEETADDILRSVDRDLEEEEPQLNSSTLEWVPPTEGQRELARQMLERAITMMMQLNETYGFYYEFEVPSPATLAAEIEDYCYERRSQPEHNKISLVTVLLDFGGVTPELFYGPVPDIPKGDLFYDPYQEYSYQKDEYGDLVAEYLLVDPLYADMQEQRHEELQMLQEQYPMLQSFPGSQDLGYLGNPLTRNMEELADNAEGTGKAVAPMPIGLRDIFCTESTGRINLNTASVPVLYGLLLSLDEADAYKVAFDIQQYRYGYQPEMSDEEMEESEGGVAGVDSLGSCDGEPKREPLDEEEDELTAEEDFAALGPQGMTDSYQDYETSYFTPQAWKCQLEHMDDETEQDLLTKEVAAVGGGAASEIQGGSVLDDVIHDLENVVVFGSTYFTATVKARTENSPIVRVGTLIVHRDLENNRMEVLQWQEFER